MTEFGEFEIETTSYKTAYRQIDADLISFRRHQTYAGPWKNIDVYGQFWVLMTAELPRNSVFYHRKGQSRELAGPVAVCIPPFSLIELEILTPELCWDAYVSRQPLGDIEIPEATLMKWDGEGPFLSRVEIAKFLQSAPQLERVNKVELESPLATKIKAYLDQNLGHELRIHEIAERFELSDSVLARVFKKSYGLTPLIYRNKMRIFESMSKLLVENQSVTSVGYDVGFADLGRFHKQFRKYASARPAQYKSKFNKKK